MAPQPESGAESGALAAQTGPMDAELAIVIEAWPTLDATTKAAIVALVKGD